MNLRTILKRKSLKRTRNIILLYRISAPLCGYREAGRERKGERGLPGQTHDMGNTLFS